MYALIRETLIPRWLARLKLRGCQQVGEEVIVNGRVWVHGGGTIRIGDRVTFDGETAPIELHAAPGSEIVIGDDVVIEGGTSIESQKTIVIGPRCQIGGFVKIIDNHFHAVSGDRHQLPQSGRVELEAASVVSARAILLPGTHLEEGARVGPGTVVSRRVPKGGLAAGIPARVSRS